MEHIGLTWQIPWYTKILMRIGLIRVIITLYEEGRFIARINLKRELSLQKEG